MGKDKEKDKELTTEDLQNLWDEITGGEFKPKVWFDGNGKHVLVPGRWINGQLMKEHYEHTPWEEIDEEDEEQE